MSVDEKKDNYVSILNTWNIGIGLTFAIVAFFLGKNKFIDLLEINVYHFISALSLSILSLLQFFIYFVQTGREMTLLHNYIKSDSIPRLKARVHFTILGLAIVFGVLIAFSDNLILFCSVMVAYNIVDTLGEIQVSFYTSERIAEVYKNASTKKTKRSIKALQKYYNYRIIFLIQFIAITVNWIALIIAILFTISGAEIYRGIATGILALNIIVGETIINLRRLKRDKKIDKNYS